MTRKGQGAVEYIIILGVIILIALIVVASLGGLGIFDFSATAQARTT
ncbi:class III signal peptide-containing protein, partial [archaeon]|nr:class III signal peptide-containing protein [archaeon]